MYKIRQVFAVAMANFRRSKRNPQIWMAFGLGVVACFLLSNKAVLFAQEYDTILQLFEPFIWTFGDANSILLISLCLLLLFADIPNLNNDVPLFLVRTTRSRWLAGQILYIVLTTFIFVTFIFFCTCVLTSTLGYTANLWSDTAAILGYSQIGSEIAIPAFIKVLEFSFPYECTMHIFGLMLGYSMIMSSLIFYCNLWRGKLGMLGGIIFSGFGFFLNPEIISKWFKLSSMQTSTANILFGWLSPLNHATYYMHNFGYDSLPKLWMSYTFFGMGAILFFALSFLKIKTYSFNFTGTEK